MSAYIVDREHVAYLVEVGRSRQFARHAPLSWYHGGKRHQLDDLTEDRVGQMLWSENVASVSHRYPSASPDDMPGPIGAWPYEYGRHRLTLLSIDPVQVLKALSCYEYQSCEHAGWETSEAKAFCEALRDAAINALPGYREAAWGAPRSMYKQGSVSR